MKKQKGELEHWDNIRNDMKYPKDDNNNGFVYGLNLLCEEGIDIIDVEWFKTAQERWDAIEKYNLHIINL